MSNEAQALAEALAAANARLDQVRAEIARATAGLRAEHAAAKLGTLTANQEQAFANATQILSDLDRAAARPEPATQATVATTAGMPEALGGGATTRDQTPQPETAVEPESAGEDQPEHVAADSQ